MKKLRYLLFSTPDRVITAISLVVGGVSLIISLTTFNQISSPPILIVIRDYFVVVTLVLLVMGLSIKYFKKDHMVKEFAQTINRQWESQHQMIHHFRDDFFWYLRNSLKKNPEMDLMQLDLVKKNYFENVCRTVLLDTRNTFLNYFDIRGFKVEDDLAVTVKLVINHEDAQKVVDVIKGKNAEILNPELDYVVTGFRDPITWTKKPERSEIMQIVYSLNEENTTFDVVVNQGENFFLSNNLQKDFEQGKYRNQNPNWIRSYNSALAVPIRYRRQGNNDATLYYGIICIDSLNPRGYDLFDKTDTFQLLAASADLLALMFGHFDLLMLASQLSVGEDKK